MKKDSFYIFSHDKTVAAHLEPSYFFSHEGFCMNYEEVSFIHRKFGKTSQLKSSIIGENMYESIHDKVIDIRSDQVPKLQGFKPSDLYATFNKIYDYLMDRDRVFKMKNLPQLKNIMEIQQFLFNCQEGDTIYIVLY
ncbi:hypothetical protein OAH77_04355 [Flavobacteriaceae bacterium]|nr:hypothetical protein [Flavobacteriaceae bacterium]